MLTRRQRRLQGVPSPEAAASTPPQVQKKSPASPAKSASQGSKKGNQAPSDSSDEEENQEASEEKQDAQEEDPIEKQRRASRFKELRAHAHRRGPQYRKFRINWTKVEERALLKGVNKYWVRRRLRDR